MGPEGSMTVSNEMADTATDFDIVKKDSGEPEDTSSIPERMSTIAGITARESATTSDNSEETISSRIENFNGSLKRDKNGKLIVPYYLSYALEISEDGKSVVGLKSFSNSSDDTNSRVGMSDLEVILKKEYDEVIRIQTESMLDKFSVPEIISQLKTGNNDFRAEDVKAVLAGRVEDAASPVAAGYARAAIDAVMKTIRTENPQKSNYQDAVDALPELISLLSEVQSDNLVTKIEDHLIHSVLDKNAVKLEMIPGLNSVDKKLAFVREQLNKEGYLKGGFKGEDGKEETNIEYISRINIQSMGVINAEYRSDKPKLDEHGLGLVDANGDAIIEMENIKLTVGSNEGKRAIIGILKNDKILGWDKPPSYKVSTDRSNRIDRHSKKAYDTLRGIQGDPHARARRNPSETEGDGDGDNHQIEDVRTQISEMD